MSGMKSEEHRLTVRCRLVLLVALSVLSLAVSSGRQSEFAAKPPDAPEQWKSLIGIYSSPRDTVYVAERDRSLFLVTKNSTYAKLTDVGRGVYRFTPDRLFNDSSLVFQWEGNLCSSGLMIGGVVFHRMMFGNENGVSFRIKALKPAAELRQIALASTPPTEQGNFLKPDFVDLSKLDETIKFDIRYATTNNFLGEKFYTQAKAFLQRPAAEAFLRAHQWLERYGYGLLIHDAYRPWYVTKMFWDATPDDKKIFVANPAEGSRHNRGCAVDLTLYDLQTGKQVEMTGGYDEMSGRSYPGFPGGTSLQRWLRDLLREALSRQGFAVYDYEWWHFDFKDWQKYPIGTKTFEEISR